MDGLLALDSSSDSCSLALQTGGVCYQRFEVVPRGHTDLVSGMLHSLLAETGLVLRELTGIVVSRGPAVSFTGIRLAVSFAQGLACGLGLPVIPISTMAGLAQQCWSEWAGNDGEFLTICPRSVVIGVLLDGKMRSYYYGAYGVDVKNGLISDVVAVEEIYSKDDVGAVLSREPPQLLLGDGCNLGWVNDLVHAIGTIQVVSKTNYLQAKYLLPLADQYLSRCDLASFKPELAVPHYLRGKQFWRNPSDS